MPRSLRKVFLCLLVLGTQLHADDLTRQRHDHYQGKIFVLRGFLSGEKLHYDAAGVPQHSSPGIWTTDAFVLIDDMKVDGQALTIKGRRMLVASRGTGFQFVTDGPKKRKKAPIVEIQAELGPDAGLLEIGALFAKIFLTESDSFVADVPLYWRTCVSAGLNDVNDPRYAGCHFSAEILAIPGVSGHADSHTPPSENPINSAQAETVRVFPAGKSISPPIPVFKPDPQFSAAAQNTGFGGGVVRLSLIVDDKGTPQNLEIIRPLGAGLDEEAMRVVSTWKFEPARKDGQPVAVHVEVEVDYHAF